MVPHGMIWSSQTSRWWVGCYIWYRKEGTGQVPSPPRPIIAVPNVTAHPPTASVPITVSMYNGPLLWIIEEESGISKISIAVCLALFNTTLKATPQLSWQTLTCFEKHMFVLSDLRIYYQIISQKSTNSQHDMFNYMGHLHGRQSDMRVVTLCLTQPGPMRSEYSCQSCETIFHLTVTSIILAAVSRIQQHWTYING